LAQHSLHFRILPYPTAAPEQLIHVINRSSAIRSNMCSGNTYLYSLLSYEQAIKLIFISLDT
jgi:hypothetical protein